MIFVVYFQLDKNINKDKKVRMSKWHVIPLSEEQQKYAATDAYVSKQYIKLLYLSEIYRYYIFIHFKGNSM